MSFSQTREIATPDPEIATIIQDICFPNESIPRLRLAINCPRVIIQEQAFPIDLRLYQETFAKISSPPRILLKSALMKVLENTSVQSASDTEQHWTNMHTIGDYVSGNSTVGAPAITIQALDLRALLRDPTVSLHHPPSFASVNIQRTYASDISITVKCGGELIDVVSRLGLVTVLPAEHADVARAKVEEEARDPWEFHE